jgi:hypothetical protein
MSGFSYSARRRWVVAILLLVSTLSAPSGVAQRGAEPRIVAIGDIHGNFDAFIEILRHAGITDATGSWIAGNTTVIQTGDFVDRGSKVKAVIDRLMALEQQATTAGGRLVVLLGNHEVMNMAGDVRDVTPEIYATFADEGSARRREAAYEAYLKFCAARAALFPRSPPRLFQPIAKNQWMDAHPAGYIEYRDAFSPQGRYGRWLRTKAPVFRIGDSVFMHAGINPNRAPRRLEDINRQVTSDVKRFDDYRSRLIDRKLILPYFNLTEILTAAQIEVEVNAALAKAEAANAQGALEVPVNPDPYRLAELLRIDTWSLFDPEGPMWYRGFATWSPEEGAVQVKNLIERYKVAHFITGHSVTETRRITPRFSGTVFLIDTGMVFPGGTASALEIKDRGFTAISADARTVLIDDAAR